MTGDVLEERLRLAQRLLVAMARAFAEEEARVSSPDVVAGGLDTLASLASGLAGELRGEALR